MDPYVGEIRCFAFGKIPVGWLPCNGQTLQIQQNPALFSLLGIRYGGDGVKTFCLPDLRGRVPVHINLADGLDIGVSGGTETVALEATASKNQLPQHTHLVAVPDASATQVVPTGHWLGNTAAPHQPYAPASGGAPVAMSSAAISGAGMNNPHNNMQPFSVLNFCIATQGLYPIRP